ncbi:uncharacterized protein EV420DRAFT_1653465 [Desarmillaria tabescens]|uniref:Uncharacterized protein n=1 Tax=Armillaria tabescens TaxID=1929756 RepID=A0AA39J423_ARMTA|nr:uncharacterized protein EV420DRAFT_1653465 [Desarmillaria tabescens]KAK0435090.1 hypothetical protein EV420DRAFT_1653465 [Desarmillaria tabescens]
MSETVRAQEIPFGWIVGPEELQIHLFRPYITESRAKFLDRKARQLVIGLKEHPEDASGLQEDFREMMDMLNGNYMILCGQEHLGSEYHVTRILDTFTQVAATSHAGVPPQFSAFWQSYLCPLVEVATPEDLASMRAQCSPAFWAAMVAEASGVSSKADGNTVSAAAVQTWSLTGSPRASSCRRCRDMHFTCLETGDSEERRCRLCCIDDHCCSISSIPPEDQRALGLAVAGIEKLTGQQKMIISLVAEMTAARKELVLFARDQR